MKQEAEAGCWLAWDSRGLGTPGGMSVREQMGRTKRLGGEVMKPGCMTGSDVLSSWLPGILQQTPHFLPCTGKLDLTLG